MSKVALVNRSKGPLTLVIKGETYMIPKGKKTKKEFELADLPNLDKTKVKVLK